jgi:hypothetical protein
MSVHRAEPAARRGTTTRDEVRNCQIWRCKRHATPKSGLWLNPLLDVPALITHSTHRFGSFCSIGSIDICPNIIYLNYCNISVELGDGIVRLHPILGDLGCIPAHIKYMQLLHSTETLCLLCNQFYTCYLQYSGAQFQWGPLGNVPRSNISPKWLKNTIRETYTWNSISTDQGKIYLIL